MPIESINPATGEKLKTYSETSTADVGSFVQQAYDAFLEWRRVDFGERAVKMKSAADLLRKTRDEFAKLMAQEMGKPISQGRAEIEKCALGCEYFAQNAERHLARELIQSDATK